jgi:hypothetical protein
MFQAIFHGRKTIYYLHTHASDYAIDVYLFQVKDNKEIPIRFMFKTLAEAQLNWSTIEKECFAMYHNLKVFADVTWCSFYEQITRTFNIFMQRDHRKSRDGI